MKEIFLKYLIHANIIITSSIILNDKRGYHFINLAVKSLLKVVKNIIF